MPPAVERLTSGRFVERIPSGQEVPPAERIYAGGRHGINARIYGCPWVLVWAGHETPLRHHVLHSPTGFEWGYGGSGPAHLALAILADATEDLELARELHQRYKWDVVCKLPHDGWTIRRSAVLAWVEAQGEGRADG